MKRLYRAMSLINYSFVSYKAMTSKWFHSWKQQIKSQVFKNFEVTDVNNKTAISSIQDIHERNSQVDYIDLLYFKLLSR